MEPSRFDDLTKALATATTRRQALKIIAATTHAGHHQGERRSPSRR